MLAAPGFALGFGYYFAIGNSPIEHATPGLALGLLELAIDCLLVWLLLQPFSKPLTATLQGKPIEQCNLNATLQYNHFTHVLLTAVAVSNQPGQ